MFVGEHHHQRVLDDTRHGRYGLGNVSMSAESLLAGGVLLATQGMPDEPQRTRTACVGRYPRCRMHPMRSISRKRSTAASSPDSELCGRGSLTGVGFRRKAFTTSTTTKTMTIARIAKITAMLPPFHRQRSVGGTVCASCPTQCMRRARRGTQILAYCRPV